MPGEPQHRDGPDGTEKAEGAPENGVEVTSLSEIPKVRLVKPLVSHDPAATTQIGKCNACASVQTFVWVRNQKLHRRQKSRL